MSFLAAHPVFFEKGAIVLYTHGLFFALGALVAVLLLVKGTRALSLRSVQTVEAALWIFLGGLFAARLGYLLSYPGQWTEVSQLWRIWEGGLVSFTGIIGSLAVNFLIMRRLPKNERPAWLDAVVLAGLIGWAIGRLGNYYAFESYGVVSSTWSIFYGRVPIQLFEAALCVILYISLARRSLQPGYRAVYALLFYLGGRLVIDIWRDEAVFAGLHISQWFSLFGIILLLSHLFLRKRPA